MDKTYIVAALRRGFSESQIAQGLGVTHSAVTQYIEAHGIAAEVAAHSQFSEVDRKLNRIEETIVDKLENSLKFAVMDPMKWGLLLKLVNGAKRRSLNEGRPVYEGGAQLVSLNLPARMTVDVRKNFQNEVIEVQGRALQTLPAGKLVQLAERPDTPQEDNRGLANEQIPKSQIAGLL